MKVIYKIRTGRGTLLNPTFRQIETEASVLCARLEKCGNLMQLYNSGGYTVCSIAEEDIVRIEK